MSDPRVSTIIPVHNGAQYLDECVRSVLAQTWSNQEALVIDDGSTDDSRAIAETFEDEGVVVLQTPENRRGAAAARNVGLARSTGDFVQFLDADDLLSPNKIESQMQELFSLPEGHIASCRWMKFRKSPDDAWPEDHAVFADLAPVDWLVTSWEGGGMMQTACWLTPRAAAERAGAWDESLRRNPDDDGEYFCRVLLQSNGVRFCDDATVYYRVPGEGSVSRRIDSEAVHSLFMTCERYKQHLLPVEDSPRARHALAMRYAGFIYRFHPCYPELTRQAMERIRELGLQRAPSVGGRTFRGVASILGFGMALRLRAWTGSKP